MQFLEIFIMRKKNIYVYLDKEGKSPGSFVSDDILGENCQLQAELCFKLYGRRKQIYFGILNNEINDKLKEDIYNFLPQFQEI